MKTSLFIIAVSIIVVFTLSNMRHNDAMEECQKIHSYDTCFTNLNR